MSDFTEQLNDVVRRRGFTVRQVANMCSTSQTTIRRWLKGKSTPHEMVREAVLNKLEISADDVFDEIVRIYYAPDMQPPNVTKIAEYFHMTEKEVLEIIEFHGEDNER